MSSKKAKDTILKAIKYTDSVLRINNEHIGALYSNGKNYAILSDILIKLNGDPHQIVSYLSHSFNNLLKVLNVTDGAWTKAIRHIAYTLNLLSQVISSTTDHTLINKALNIIRQGIETLSCFALKYAHSSTSATKSV